MGERERAKPGRKRLTTGDLLRAWRELRGKSQIELAVAAETSARHLSFIETGRTLPAEDLLGRLCEALEVPPRDQLLVFRSAGYLGHYVSATIDSEQRSLLKKTLEFALKQLEPWPAIVINREAELLASNTSMQKTIAWLGRGAPLLARGTSSGLDLSIDPDGLRPWLVNWEEVARRMLHRLYGDSLLEDADESLAKHYDRLVSHDGVAEVVGEGLASDGDPLIPFHFRRDGRDFHFDSLVTSVGTPTDIAFQAIRLRYWVPTNDEAERLLEEVNGLAAGAAKLEGAA